MKKDIEIPVVNDVYVAVVHEWNEEFLSKDWNAYIINDRDTPIETVLIVSKGYDSDIKTSTMRHGIGKVEAKSFEKIELMQEDVLKLNNEFYVTFFADDKLYEKKYIFRKNTINERALREIPVMEVEGVLVK
ncbi:hypothetical protein GWK08_12825 [Leptobacterium flavescens]|uniref:Phenylalanyl-tRNA synthetase subunit alpha n=1 Tax=Leptobacterium flavescens TaxID=472055 RepID=A0A6P0URC5_9FLAO|nr:hypothetical protein [Leptobacterium flavescens]NER14329.1 hypothetical protein [Leptobacterium flavescens]